MEAPTILGIIIGLFGVLITTFVNYLFLDRKKPPIRQLEDSCTIITYSRSAKYTENCIPFDKGTPLEVINANLDLLRKDKRNTHIKVYKATEIDI
jgi:hypothetical protein